MVRAAVMPDKDIPIEVREFPRPRLEEGAILLRTIYSEVCGTDVHLHHGHLAGVPYPIIPGHVNVGEIAEIGGRVTDVHGDPLRAGQVVTFLDVHETCGQCWFCTVARASTRCPKRRVYGITYSADEGLLGGWSEMIYLKPIGRYLLLTWGLHKDFDADQGSELTILESEHPWGPFRLVYYEELWESVEVCPYCPRVPLQWFDAERLSGWLLYSGSWHTVEHYRPHVRPFELALA